MFPRVIIFFGPDGSGKSTQVKLLTRYLRSEGQKVKKVWIRSPHSLAYLLSRLLIRIGFSRRVTNPYGHAQTILSLPNSPKFKIFWGLLELISVKPLVLLKVILPLFLGYTIVAERYVPDTVVNIAYYAGNLDFLKSPTAMLFMRLVPRRSCLLHLDSNYSSILLRRGSIADAADFIEFQRTAYKTILSLVKAKSLNTSVLSIEQTFNEIKTAIRNLPQES